MRGRATPPLPPPYLALPLHHPRAHSRAHDKSWKVGGEKLVCLGMHRPQRRWVDGHAGRPSLPRSSGPMEAVDAPRAVMMLISAVRQVCGAAGGRRTRPRGPNHASQPTARQLLVRDGSTNAAEAAAGGGAAATAVNVSRCIPGAKGRESARARRERRTAILALPSAAVCAFYGNNRSARLTGMQHASTVNSFLPVLVICCET